jgi:hypothetical protein
MHVKITDGDIVVDAALIAEVLDIPLDDVRTLMHAKEITTICEKGVDADEGEYRLSFFSRSRRAYLYVDTGGRILRRSIIDFGARPLPASMHGVRTGG